MFKIIGADQKPYGPVAEDQLRQWISEGRADGRTLAQAEGSMDWKPLASFPEFAALFASMTPPPAAGQPPQPAWTPPAAKPDIPTYLPHAIIVTLCCCLPLGIPAIVYAAQVSSKLAAGDIAGARTASNNARTWFWIALVLGLVSQVIPLLLLASGFWGHSAPRWRM